MTDLHLDIAEANGANRVVVIPTTDEDTLETLAGRITKHAEIDGHAVLEIALESKLDDFSKHLRGAPIRHKKLQLHRVCVEVHFETETERHWFPAQARWARVHRWACKKFEVATDACANLELREGAADGPPINEREPIGKSDECKVAWLVKPGPEQNG